MKQMDWKKAAGALRKIWDKGGFYVALAVSLALLGTAAYGLRNRPSAPAQPTDTPAPLAAAKQWDERLKDVTGEGPGWPVSGRTVLTEHSPEEAIWSDTLKMWQAHTGLDILGVPGEAVRAVLDGTVTAVYKDALLGYTVEMRHEGYASRYANLSTGRAVKVGDRLMKGDVLGAMGDSAASESAMPCHVHFEAWKGEEWAPPTD